MIFSPGLSQTLFLNNDDLASICNIRGNPHFQVICDLQTPSSRHRKPPGELQGPAGRGCRCPRGCLGASRQEARPPQSEPQSEPREGKAPPLLDPRPPHLPGAQAQNRDLLHPLERLPWLRCCPGGEPPRRTPGWRVAPRWRVSEHLQREGGACAGGRDWPMAPRCGVADRAVLASGHAPISREGWTLGSGVRARFALKSWQVPVAKAGGCAGVPRVPGSAEPPPGQPESPWSRALCAPLWAPGTRVGPDPHPIERGLQDKEGSPDLSSTIGRA